MILCSDQFEILDCYLFRQEMIMYEILHKKFESK